MDCEDCKNYVEYAGYQKLTPICKECVDEGYHSDWKNIKSKFEPKHKPTNGDRIRSMSDEELAEFMCHNVSNGTVNCEFCSANEFCHMGHNGWLDWLKKEVEECTKKSLQTATILTN